MLTQRAPVLARFTRNDATRLVIAGAILVAAMTAILAIDLLPQESLQLQAGDLAPRDITAPRAVQYDSEVQTEAARQAARDAVPNQYDFTPDKAIAIAAEQQLAFETRVDRVDSAFDLELTSEDRRAFLETAVPGLPDNSRSTLMGLERLRWQAVRAEASRVLDATLRTELKDDEVAEARTRLDGRMTGDLSEAERMLGADLIRPLLVPNSSFSEDLTETEREVQAAAVAPVAVRIAQNQVIARSGEPLDAADIESIDALGLADDSGGRGQLRGLAAAVDPAGRDAPGLAVAVPPGPLAPRQRAAAHRAAARRRDAHAQGHRRPLDHAVLPAHGGHRHAPGHPPRRLGGGHRPVDRGHPRWRGRWRAGRRRLAGVRRLHLPGRVWPASSACARAIDCRSSSRRPSPCSS